MGTVLDSDLDTCTGCGACINGCPVQALEYTKDRYGFLFPLINREKCIDCGLCYNICPRESSDIFNRPLQGYAAVNKNKTVLMNSSSGGGFSALAEYILSSNGVVFGCMMDKDNRVYHVCINSINDLPRITRSKYVQSYMGDIFHKIEEEVLKGRWVLVSGTPCIVAGVKTYLKKHDLSKLILVDVVCHGVPSQTFFDSYLEFLNIKYNGISKYQFRTKLKADNGMSWLHSFYINKKKIIRNWPEDSFTYLYMNSYIYRESCYSCRYAKTERVGDLSLCDFWNWDKYHFEFDKEASVSGILVNTKKGQALWKAINSKFIYYNAEISNIVINNGCLSRPSIRPKEREAVLDFWKNKGYEALDKEFRKRELLTIWKNKIFRLAPTFIKELYLNILKK